MARKIRLGMIGGGEGSFIGAIHYKAAMLDGYYQLVCGAFSSDYEKSLRSAKHYYVKPSRVYTTWQEMYEKEATLKEEERMEAVIIATPNHLHHPQAMMALDKGFHVICDKPVTISLMEAVELEQKVKESGLIFALTHTYTGYPMVKEARELVASGKLGKIRKVVVEYPQGWLSKPLEQQGNKQASWRANPNFNGPGGCLGDIGVHAENLAEYVTGLSIDELNADITSFVPGRELDDDASVLVRFHGGAKGLIFASQISAGEENDLNIKVYGEKGGLEWHQMEPNTLLLKWLDQPMQVLRAGANYQNLSEKTRWNCRTPGGHPEGYIEAFANIYRNAAYHILEKTDPNFSDPGFIEYPTISDGVRGMKFIEKVIESAKSEEKWLKFDS
jgi:predicted dehydrogenase